MAVDLGTYTQYVALGLGALFVLVVLGYIAATRSAGREGDERAHEKAVNKGLRRLSRTEQLVADESGSNLAHDLEWLAEHGREVSRRQRVRQWFRRRVPRGLVAHGCLIEDADGRTIHVLSVNGRRLAHRDVDRLVEDALTVADALDKGETPPATMSENYYEDIVDGFVDLRESRGRVRGDCHTRLQSNMRRNEELPYQDLYERFVYDAGFRYPPEIVEAKIEELEGRVLRQKKDGTLTYQRFV